MIYEILILFKITNFIQGDQKEFLISADTVDYKTCIEYSNNIQAEILLPSIHLTIESKCEPKGQPL
jgi:hypothetical protein